MPATDGPGSWSSPYPRLPPTFHLAAGLPGEAHDALCEGAEGEGEGQAEAAVVPLRLQHQVVGVVHILGAEAARLAVVVGRAGLVVGDLQSPPQQAGRRRGEGGKESGWCRWIRR